MTHFKTTAPQWKDYLSLTGIALLAHGLVLLNDGNYVDGWHFNFFAEHGYWDKMKSMWYELGRPLGFWWVYIPFKSYFNIYIFKFLSFLPLLIVSWIQYYFLNRFTPLPRGTAWFVAAFTLCWPFYHMIVWGQYPDHIPSILFYGGWLLYFLHTEKESSPALKGLALLVLYISFFYQAFLVLHYVIAAVLFLYTMGYPGYLAWAEIRKQLPVFLKQHWLLLVIPFVFFFSKPYLFPVAGRYAGYYSVDIFSLKTLVFFLGGLVNTLFGPLIGLGYYYAVLPVLALALMAGFWFYKKQPPSREETGLGPLLWFLVLGFLLTASIVFAHAANHKMAMLLSYQARHSRQTGLGAAFLTLASIHYLGQRCAGLNWPVKKFLSFSALATLIFLNINIYLTYQSHWAKNKAVMHQLSQEEPLKNVNIYFMTNHLPMGMGTDYHYAEVSLTLYEAWGGGQRYLGVPPYLQKHRYDREWIGIVLNELKHGRNPLPAGEAYLNEAIPKIRVAQKMVGDWKEERGYRTGVMDFQPGGCMGEIIVRPAGNASEPSIALRYLSKRMFTPETLPAFYGTIAEVELKPLNIDAQGNPCP